MTRHELRINLVPKPRLGTPAEEAQTPDFTLMIHCRLKRVLLAIAVSAAIAHSLRAEEPTGKVSLPNLSDLNLLPTGDQIDPDQPVVSTPYLPPLEAELHLHGGSSLYEPIDVVEQLYRPPGSRHSLPRLTEDWRDPQPLAWPDDYLGPGRILWDPAHSWFGASGYQWEPRLVAYGLYELFGVALENGGERRDGLGHQLYVDLDLALTGTERFHVRFRPLGGKNSGGSFYQFSNPEGYQDNSDGVPQRWWFEGELQSIFGGWLDDPAHQWDVNVTLGKFPLVFHNFLLMNDEVTGIILGKNTLLIPPFSNVNVQTFYLFDDVDVPSARSTDVVGTEITADYRMAFLEFTYAHTFDQHSSDYDADYFALSGTQFFGPLTLAGRAMFRVGRDPASDDGQLYVIESSRTRLPPHWLEEFCGVELTVSYLNVFHATSGWQPIAGGGFDRLRNLFALNPLLQIAAGRAPADTLGAALGVQLFRRHQDESIIPEVAIEDFDGETVWGVGLQYERKLGSRTYLNLRALKTWSGNGALVREGVFASTFVLF